MYAITAGLSGECLDIIKQGLDEAFGGAPIEVKSLAGSSLKREMRLAGGSSCVLVVLDGVSESLVKGVDKGVLTSKKYLPYKDAKSLVEGLNSLFSINLGYEETGSSIIENDSSWVDETVPPVVYHNDELNDLKEILKGKDLVINNLTAQLKEARDLVPVIDDSSSRDKLLQYKSELSKAQDEVHQYKRQLEVIENSAGGNKEEVERWKSQSFSIEKDISELREKVFIQDTVIRNKDSEIKSITDEVFKLKSEGNSELRDRVLLLEEEKSRLESELSQTKEGVSDTELAKQVDLLKLDVSKLSKDNDSLTELVNTAERYRTLAEESEKSSKEELEKVRQELFEVTQENIKLKLEVTNLQGMSMGGNFDDKLHEVQDDVFYKVGEYSASPGGKIPFKVDGLRDWYENITFMFAGSSASEHGTYKELLYRVENSNRNKHLVVDLGTETSIDYVMSIRSLNKGVQWIREGGAITQYITPTPLKGVSVLSMGVGYFNDSYLLTLDWARRIDELNSLGYKVFIYCGCLGNIVGRLMLDAVKDVGEVIIVNKGTLVSMRSLILNMMGVDVPKNAELAFFEYNDNSYGLYTKRLQGKYRCTFLTSEGVREDG